MITNLSLTSFFAFQRKVREVLIGTKLITTYLYPIIAYLMWVLVLVLIKEQQFFDQHKLEKVDKKTFSP